MDLTKRNSFKYLGTSETNKIQIPDVLNAAKGSVSEFIFQLLAEA